jgi:hypothetical protein
MARFTEPRTWIAELEDGNHEITLKGWPIGITAFGITHNGSGCVCVDGKPVPYERTIGSGFVFAYLQQEWRFAIGQHAGVVKQGMAGVPIWDLWVDGRQIEHAAMDQRAVFGTAAQVLIAIAFSIAVVTLVIVLAIRLSALVYCLRGSM